MGAKCYFIALTSIYRSFSTIFYHFCGSENRVSRLEDFLLQHGVQFWMIVQEQRNRFGCLKGIMSA